VGEAVVQVAPPQVALVVLEGAEAPGEGAALERSDKETMVAGAVQPSLLRVVAAVGLEGLERIIQQVLLLTPQARREGWV